MHCKRSFQYLSVTVSQILLGFKITSQLISVTYYLETSHSSIHIHTSHFREVLIQLMRLVLSSLLFRSVHALRRISYPCLNVNDYARNKFYICLQQLPLREMIGAGFCVCLFYYIKCSNFD